MVVFKGVHIATATASLSHNILLSSILYYILYRAYPQVLPLYETLPRNIGAYEMRVLP